MENKQIDKGKKLTKCYVWLLAICMTNFFGFYKFLPFGKSFYSYDYIHISVCLVSLMFLLYKVVTRKKIQIKGSFINVYMVLLMLIAVEVIWTYSKYHQPISLTFKEAFYYIVPFLGYFTFLQYKENVEFDDVADIIVKASIITSIVALIVFTLYTFAGINILQLNDSISENFRNGTIRFSIGTIVANIGIVISITRIMQKKSKKLDLYNTIVVFLNIWLVDKSRTALLYIIIIVLISMLLGKKVGRLWKVIILFAIVACVIGVFISYDTVRNEVSVYFNSDAGIMMRFNTIEFYMNQFQEYPVLGMGLLSSSKDVAGWQLLYGPAGYFYRDDVGIVGLLNKFGICGLLWIIAFFITIMRIEKKTKLQEGEVVRNIMIYCVVTLINLSFMDFQRVFYMMDIMILTEMLIVYKKNKLQNNGR